MDTYRPVNRFAEGLRTLYGRKMVVASEDASLRDELAGFLRRYGVEVTLLDSASAIEAEIEKRLLGTQRVYLAILIDEPLADAMLPRWRSALRINPVLGETPVAVLASSPHEAAWQAVEEVRYVLSAPPQPRQMLKWLGTISRWRSFVQELEKVGPPPVHLQRRRKEVPGKH